MPNRSDYADLQREIPDGLLGNNHVYFLPYLMGERSPLNDTDARGSFVGMRMDTKRRDMILAVLEGVAFAIRDNFEIAKAQGISVSCVSLCGGGAKSELWQKILCNVLGVDITMLQTEQGPGYGAGMLAMVGCGEFETVKECADTFVEIKNTIRCQPEIAARYEEKYETFKALYPSLKNVFKRMKSDR